MTGAVATPRYPLGPALEFLERLWALNHAMEKLSGHMSARLGVTAQQRLIIRCLGRYPGLSPGQLASMLHVDPGTISAALRRLERKGLLRRRRDPSDQRRAALRLTAKGRALDCPTAGTVEHAVEQLIADASGIDLARTARVLETLTVLLQREMHGE